VGSWVEVGVGCNGGEEALARHGAEGRTVSTSERKMCPWVISIMFW
jgi:hypothetical protein